MASFDVGKDVLAYCGKCKLALSHIIIALKADNNIAKVQCNTCKATHAFKDPALQKVKTKKSAKTSRNQSTAVNVTEVWEVAIKNAIGPSKPYSIRAIFEKGDLIEHPKFGQGVVDRIVDNDKISIIFKNDMKILAHSR